jgi:hypothetical protein
VENHIKMIVFHIQGAKNSWVSWKTHRLFDTVVTGSRLALYHENWRRPSLFHNFVELLITLNKRE